MSNKRYRNCWLKVTLYIWENYYGEVTEYLEELIVNGVMREIDAGCKALLCDTVDKVLEAIVGREMFEMLRDNAITIDEEGNII